MPFMQWQLDENTVVRPLELGDTQEVYTLITQNRQHLDRWLRWSSALQNEAAVKLLSRSFRASWNKVTAFTMVSGTRANWRAASSAGTSTVKIKTLN